MGNLAIRKVSYYGDKYYFESPKLLDGINIIVGDNGSGKSTFSYFVEYGLGGAVKFFKRDNSDEKYSLITEDSNNYVELDIEINGELFIFKRFIGANDIFIKDQEKIHRLSLNRNAQNSDILFSDWMLQKLNINPFELNLGTYSWMINFNDLYRLLNYDQDTPPAKIYKAPSTENFINDSIIIRKTIFETLIGLTSQEYNDKLGELKVITKEKNEANALLNNFLGIYPNLNEDFTQVSSFISEQKEQLKKLHDTRDKIQQENVNYDDKFSNIGEIQDRITRLDLKISSDSVKKRNLEAEKIRVESLIKEQQDEISLIEKVIFTHEKLNLFSLEICPFCGGKPNQKEGHCICGSIIDKDNYEKFVYNSSEYKDIISHKKKSIETIKSALSSYYEEISQLDKNINIDSKESADSKESLKKVISRIDYSGNSDIIDQLNEKIIEVKECISENEQLLVLLFKKKELEDKVSLKNSAYKTINEDFQRIQKKFESSNKSTIQNFNSIFNQLMILSTCDCKIAEIDDDYMPIIDKGEYKEKSAKVPIRLMYYFSSFSMGLKYEKVKHPHFLLIDTPESEGIDEDNLKTNLLLLEKAILLSKKDNENIPFQVIMTTGYEKYPNEYEHYVKLRFNKKERVFILKETI